MTGKWFEPLTENRWGTENAGVENAIRAKLQGVENAGVNCMEHQTKIILRKS